ncbi:MAG: SpoIIE family protein phosphatase [Prevotellaceae bacterium]|nr:SpoIIE family protein phosphatase [Prevotellaceae bacterium]
MRKIFMSLTAKLCFYILTLTVIIFCSIAFVFNKYSMQREEEQASRYTSVLLQNMVQKIDRKLTDVERSVAEAVPEIRRNLSNPDAMMGLVRDMVWKNSMVIGGSIAFEPGYYPEHGKYFMEYVTLDSHDNLRGKHLGGESYDYFKMQWYTEAKKQKQSIWSEPYFDEGGGNILMTTYSLPLLDDEGKVFAVLTADVSLEDLVESVNVMRPYPDSYSFILSRSGTYLAHPDKEVILNKTVYTRAKDLDNEELVQIGKKMIKGQRGTLRLDIEGTDVLASYTPLLRTGWSICCVCPYRTIMNQLGSTAMTMIVILLIGLVLLMICVRWILVYATRPMVQLANAAYRIAGGHFDDPLPEIGTKDEMRKLHDAFAHMQRSLKSYIEELTETTRSKERIESELHIARTIQMSMIPQIFSPFPEWEYLELYGYLRPAKEVGGDFYDFFIRDEKLFFTIGDVSGKGIPASLVMAITRTLFRIMSGSYTSPDKIASMLNHAISEKNDANMFITMYIGVLDLNNGKLTFCNAGHNPPLMIMPDGVCRMQSVKPNLPIGIMDEFPFVVEEETLPDNTAILLYTDGLTEAENINHEQLGETSLIEKVRSCSGMNVQEIVEQLQQQVTVFAGEAEQSDDLTMMCMRYHCPSNKKHNDMKNQELVIRNSLGESTKLYPFLLNAGNDFSLPTSMINSINLALEEALVNSIQYAYPEGTEGTISLSIQYNESSRTLTFVLKDQGKPFDPTKVADADTTLPLEERPIGGLGIFLIRQIMDDVRYEYVDTSNILTMTKTVE